MTPQRCCDKQMRSEADVMNYELPAHSAGAIPGSAALHGMFHQLGMNPTRYGRSSTSGSALPARGNSALDSSPFGTSTSVVAPL